MPHMKYGLFNNTVSSSDYIALHGRMISELWIENKVNETGCGLI
jgi:hypothetical protein